MSYADVDKILIPWLKRHGLHVFTKHHEEEVRAIDVVDDAGDRYGIGIYKPDASGIVKVFAGYSKSKRNRKGKEYESTLSDLENVLEGVYSQIMEWVNEAGHTRTPVL